MKKYISYLMTALIAAVSFSCDFNDSPSLEEGQARVNFYLVDAPGDFDEVWVEVLALRVKAGEIDLADEEDGDDESAWEEIPYENGSQMINLLDLTGNNSQLLGDANLEAGSIQQLRLILGENNYVVKDGEEFPLKTPSAQQSGLKIKLYEEIEAGNSYDLVIDFDVAKSIVVAGNSGNVILKPVLRAYMQETAGIMGQVLPLEAQPISVSTTVDGEVVTTFTDTDGNFKIQGLEPGTYSLLITPEEGYVPVTIDGVVVEEGEITQVDAVTLEEQQ
ncbi:DUF4382 domain-containing protein [Algoriphagus hitonicola]|uniref:Carboxypeptidase regulatory-like domain-containing protein n=1 Tax=Algoriphagus hitonicola TaxID=435880 RepID=A0A1I2SFS4_9BACT|nr:DUF4382 domain-containing protein [Algoriphagus hitonicola]SFG51675.1 Carboxypeptidase regulatory-like domain-containing protein [Algoriphagus hitonicola]